MKLNLLVELCKAATDLEQSFIFKDGILAFGGTNSLSDWYFNLDMGNHLGYHKGFYRMTRRLTLLSGIPHDQVNLVTGYSLGGAVASIYAVQNNKPCVTFSAPKILHTIKEPSELIVRFTAQYDPVSYVPFGLHHPCGVSREFPRRDWNTHSLKNYM
jgi:hypothetical protein